MNLVSLHFILNEYIELLTEWDNEMQIYNLLMDLDP